MIHCLRPRPHILLTFPPFPVTCSPPKRALLKPSSLTVKALSTQKMPSSIVEHIVLFKVKPGTDPSAIDSMLNGLNGLISLDQVLHLTAGPVLRTRSSLFNFTHMLHSRYKTKDDLAAYSAHPDHMGVVKGNVLPICEDLMAVDWVAEPAPEGEVLVLRPGSALKVSFLKLKEGLGDEVKGKVLGVIEGIKDSGLGPIEQVTSGDNFSPARAKGFSIASLAVFKGVEDMEAADANLEAVSSQKEKVREYLDGVIVVDYVVPSSQSSASASL